MWDPMMGYKNWNMGYLWTIQGISIGYSWNHPFLLMQNPAQILKTSVHLQFLKISDWRLVLG